MNHFTFTNIELKYIDQCFYTTKFKIKDKLDMIEIYAAHWMGTGHYSAPAHIIVCKY